MAQSQPFGSNITDHNHAAGSYITFRAGDAEFALSVKYIRYITTVENLTRRTSPSTKGPNPTVFDYAGETLVLYGFNSLVNASSQLDECEQLIKMLGERRKDHIDWIHALEESIRDGVPFTKATNPHKCAFGLWYDRYRARDAELQGIMAKFDEPHKRIHSLAEKLLRLANEEGEVKRAVSELESERFTTLKLLLNLFEQAITRLQELNKPVVLVVDDGESRYGLQVESIGDIKQFDPQSWLPDQQAEENCCYEGFFQSQNKALFLNIVPGRLLHVARSSA